MEEMLEIANRKLQSPNQATSQIHSPSQIWVISSQSTAFPSPSHETPKEERLPQPIMPKLEDVRADDPAISRSGAPGISGRECGIIGNYPSSSELQPVPSSIIPLWVIHISLFEGFAAVSARTPAPSCVCCAVSTASRASPVESRAWTRRASMATAGLLNWVCESCTARVTFQDRRRWSNCWTCGRIHCDRHVAVVDEAGREPCAAVGHDKGVVECHEVIARSNLVETDHHVLAGIVEKERASLWNWGRWSWTSLHNSKTDWLSRERKSKSAFKHSPRTRTVETIVCISSSILKTYDRISAKQIWTSLTQNLSLSIKHFVKSRVGPAPRQ